MNTCVNTWNADNACGKACDTWKRPDRQDKKYAVNVKINASKQGSLHVYQLAVQSTPDVGMQ